MKLDHREEIASFNLTNSETIQYPKEREREILGNSEKLNMTYDLDRHERHLLLDDTCLLVITAFFSFVCSKRFCLSVFHRLIKNLLCNEIITFKTRSPSARVCLVRSIRDLGWFIYIILPLEF